MKKLLFTFIAMLLPLMASADRVKVGDLYYNFVLKAKIASVASCPVGECYSGDIVIPATVEYNGVVCNVTSIGEYAFVYYELNYYGNAQRVNNYWLNSVVIPESVKQIGSQAFYLCVNLNSVTLPDGLEEIGQSVFMGCNKLTSIKLPKSFTTIPTGLFSGCESLSSVDISDNITEIGGSAFANCKNLTKINLKNAEVIGSGAFFGCEKLTEISMSNKLRAIADDAFKNCSKLSNIEWPDSLKEIGSGAFSGCKAITSLDLPRVVRIGTWAFYGCNNLTTVILGKDILSIGNRSFENCIELTDVYIYGRMPDISSNAFNNSMIEYSTLHIPAGFIDYCKSAAPWNGFGTYSPLSEEDMGLDAVKCKRIINFADPKVKAICVANWDYNGDGELSEAEAAYPSSLSNMALWDNNYDGIYDDNEISNAGSSIRLVFKGNTDIKYFEELQYFTGLNHIEYNTFYNCTKLSKIILPENITHIDNAAFMYCGKLSSVIIPNKVKVIGDWAFDHCSGLTSVVLPNSLITIGKDAFYSCSSLSTVTIPNFVTSIGQHAFAYCSGLTSIELSHSLTSLESNILRGCENLTSIAIPWGVTTIGDYGISECKNLVSITIPNTVTSMGKYAIYTCRSLKSITIPSSVTSIGESTFTGCTGLTELRSFIKEPFSVIWGSIYKVPLYVPAGTKELYEETERWNKFANIIEMEPDEYNDEGTVGETDILISQANFPDTKFREFLLAQSYGQDGLLTDEEINGITKLTISNKDIADLSGIEFFTALTDLDCQKNKLKALDLSKNSKMTSLSINKNNIEGAKMGALINSLPTNTTSTPYPIWIINNSSGNEGNECTKAQVAALKAKGWTPLIYSNADNDWVEFEGSDKQLNCLVIWAKDGTRATHALKDIIQVRFTDETLIVSKGGQKSYYPMSNLMRFTYDSFMLGDVNGDSKVDVVDVTKTISHIFGLTPSEFSEKAADLNGDGAIDSDDVSAMATLAVGGQTITIPANSQPFTGDAFYIYRNDGGFNAFFRDEVEKIEYSNSDTDGNLHDVPVSQLVYTADSIYNIPLAAIDSVGFVTPSPIVNSKVFPLTDEHSPYISNADYLSFTMSGSTPNALLPKVGDIVVATAECTAFPEGIVAKVETIEQGGNGIQYECSKAYLDEVFDQLVVYEKSVAGDVTDAARGFDMQRASLTHTLWNRQWTETITYSGTTTVLNVGDRATATITVKKTLKTPFFFQLDLKNDLTTTVDFTAESSASISKERQIGNTITAGRIVVPYTMGLLWLEPKLSLFGYFEEKGKVELKYGGHFNRTDNLSFTYTKGEWNFSHAPITDVGTDVAKLSMEGSAEIGLKPQIDFSLNGQQAGFGLSGRVGLKEYINFVFDATRLSDGGLYDAMRDSYCRTTIPWSINVHASANIFSRYNASSTDEGFATFSHTFAPNEEPRWGDDRYIFPLFDDVNGERLADDKTKANATASVSRIPLLPVQLGFSLLGSENNILQTKYDSRSYKAGSLFDNFNCQFNNLDKSEKYTIRPSVKLLGYDILASPSSEMGETEFPVEITYFKVTKLQYDKGAFTNDGQQYDYRFAVSVTVTLDDADGIADWGYAYLDPNGREALMSLKNFGTSYTDTRYAYFRNEPVSTCTLYGYVKYADSNEIVYDVPHKYPLRFYMACTDEQHPHLVDLDLPSGTLWYCSNFGADKPEGWGGYYAYAESNEKKSYMLQNYLYYYNDTQFGGQYSYFENIGANLQNFGTCISGKVGYDVVARNWGNDGRMPTKEEALELIEKCTWTWSYRNGVPGYEVTGSNGNSIFLPASGQKVETTTYQGDPNRLTYYRTGDLSPRQWGNQGLGYTWGIRFKQDSYEMSDACAKAFGYVIRPVKSREQ